MAANGQHQLKIDETITLRNRILTQTQLTYAGMPNDRTFSLVVTKTAGYQGMAYNLYLPTDQRHLQIGKANITIDSVSPTTIQLTVE